MVDVQTADGEFQASLSEVLARVRTAVELMNVAQPLTMDSAVQGVAPARE